MSDKDFDNVFREQLGDLSSTPSELNWVAIESQLPAAPANRSSYWRAVTLAVLLLGSIGSGLWWWNSQSSVTTLQPLVDHSYTLQFDASTVATLLAQQKASSNTITPPPTTNTGLATGFTGAVANAVPVGNAAVDNNSISLPAENRSMAALSPLAIDALPNAATITVNPVFYTPDASLRPQAVSGLRVGPIMQAQFSMHSGGDLAPSGSTLLPRGGVAYGMAFHYDISPRVGIEVDALISSAEGMRVRLDNPVNPTAGEMAYPVAQSNYLRIPVLLKLRKPIASAAADRPSIWNYAVGMQYGRVNWVNLDEVSALIMPSQFNTHEIGYVAGLSRDWYLGKNYLFTVGTRAALSHSLSDVTSSPITYQIGLHAQLNWLRPKRSKVVM